MTGTKLEILLVEEEVEELSEKGEGRERNSHTLHVASRLRVNLHRAQEKERRECTFLFTHRNHGQYYGDSQQHAHLAGRRDRYQRRRPALQLRVRVEQVPPQILPRGRTEPQRKAQRGRFF